MLLESFEEGRSGQSARPGSTLIQNSRLFLGSKLSEHPTTERSSGHLYKYCTVRGGISRLLSPYPGRRPYLPVLFLSSLLPHKFSNGLRRGLPFEGDLSLQHPFISLILTAGPDRKSQGVSVLLRNPLQVGGRCRPRNRSKWVFRTPEHRICPRSLLEESSITARFLR